jgi:sulfhydrogenase subunit gamma (sulfur reductase)
MEQANPYLPNVAEIIGRKQESDTIFTLRLRFLDQAVADSFHFLPGQFNMVYLYGVGEAAISIVSDPEEENIVDHTIRVVGRMTEGLSKLAVGDQVGLRGPYGRGWPLDAAQGKDVVVVTGGLGCAPTVSVINYIMRRREQYGTLNILQGVRHPRELIYRERYDEWRGIPKTKVLLCANSGDAVWPWPVCLVTDLFDQIEANPDRTVAMMCGPEGMMIASAKRLMERGLHEESIYFSMERNMQCAVGFCGHCQYGGSFVCKNGPVFSYPELKPLLGIRGF